MIYFTCRYCLANIYRLTDTKYWRGVDGKYYCVNYEHGLIHEPAEELSIPHHFVAGTPRVS